MNASSQRPSRRPVLLSVVIAAVFTLGACGSINDAFDGINPISRTLDESSKKKAASGSYRQPLAIPPDYSLRPPAGKAETRRIPDADTKAKPDDGKAKVKVADPKKIDLGASSSGEKVNSKAIDTRRKVVTGGRAATGGKAIVKDGKRSKGEDELLKRSKKNNDS